jgi:hypothetical protein
MLKRDTNYIITDEGMEPRSERLTRMEAGAWRDGTREDASCEAGNPGACGTKSHRGQVERCIGTRARARIW